MAHWIQRFHRFNRRNRLAGLFRPSVCVSFLGSGNFERKGKRLETHHSRQNRKRCTEWSRTLTRLRNPFGFHTLQLRCLCWRAAAKLGRTCLPVSGGEMVDLNTQIPSASGWNLEMAKPSTTAVRLSVLASILRARPMPFCLIRRRPLASIFPATV